MAIRLKVCSSLFFSFPMESQSPLCLVGRLCCNTTGYVCVCVCVLETRWNEWETSEEGAERKDYSHQYICIMHDAMHVCMVVRHMYNSFSVANPKITNVPLNTRNATQPVDTCIVESWCIRRSFRFCVYYTHLFTLRFFRRRKKSNARAQEFISIFSLSLSPFTWVSLRRHKRHAFILCLDCFWRRWKERERERKRGLLLISREILCECILFVLAYRSTLAQCPMEKENKRQESRGRERERKSATMTIQTEREQN